MGRIAGSVTHQLLLSATAVGIAFPWLEACFSYKPGMMVFQSSGLILRLHKTIISFVCQKHGVRVDGSKHIQSCSGSIGT